LKPYSPDLWAWDNLLGNAVIMVVVAIVSTILLVLIESDICLWARKFTFRAIPEEREKEELDLDEDVIAEEDRLDKTRGSTVKLDDEEGRTTEGGKEAIRVHQFRKVYTTLLGNPFLAVERISFGLAQGECFALLGVNGAGKSTTFKSLTRDIIPTRGEIKIAGYDVQTEFEDARKLIGYCPQHDAIFDLMTVEEHLWFYVRIKGIP